MKKKKELKDEFELDIEFEIDKNNRVDMNQVIELVIAYNKLFRTYEKQKDNWNELKEWLEKELGDRINPNKDKWLTGVYDAYRETIDKMQELEQGSDSKW